MSGRSATDLARLRWRCRRGTKELDALLTRFLAKDYQTLDEPRREAFEALLECQDDQLIEWLLQGREAGADAGIREIVARIRASAGF